jgi:uncharacterized coiled-coil protein SlyX
VDAINERIERLAKVVSTSDKETLFQLRTQLEKKIKILQEQIDGIHDAIGDMRTHVKSTHANHAQEMHAKTSNLSSTIEKLNHRIIVLEKENRDQMHEIKVLQAAVANSPGPDSSLRDEMISLKSKLSKINTQQAIAPQPSFIPQQTSEKHAGNSVVQIDSKLGLEEDTMNKIGLKSNLDEEENVDSAYIDKKYSKSFVSGVYQTWTAKNKVKRVPQFTLTLYAYKFKTPESAAKFFDFSVKDAKSEETHSQETLTMADDGYLFEKPVNTLIVKGKEVEIGKSEAVFYKGTIVYVLNSSYIGSKFNTSDMKSLAAFLCKK